MSIHPLFIGTMIGKIICILFTLTYVSANLFDFIQHQFQGSGQQAQRQTPGEYESANLNSGCSKYLCPETSICVEDPKFCPCPYPSSQLRCFLPNGRYVCISKPAGEVSLKYSDPKTNWKIDAKDDDIRDCGWVGRAWKGMV